MAKKEARNLTEEVRHPDLPLHGGHVPALLADRMTELGMTIAEQVVLITG
jgi:hypothetical protein